MALDDNVARRLVERYLLTADEQILEVRVGTAAVLVGTSHRGWRLEELDRIGPTTVGPGFRLVVVTSAITDGSEPGHAFALTADDALYDLAKPQGLRDFYRDVQPRPDPMSTACLVALFVDPGDERRRLADGQQPPDLPAPTISRDDPTTADVLLYTTVRRYIDDGPARRVVQRWIVTTGRDSVRWTLREDE
jgi:hypothetical protein